MTSGTFTVVKRLWSGIVARIKHLGSRSKPAPSPGPTKAAPRRRPRTATEPGPARPALPSSAPPAGRQLAYSPQLDGAADPGEIVWAWVPYEEDASQGKDRPVLVVGREGGVVLGLMLSSQIERDGQRNWLALGPGGWDRESRPSWVRLDRVLRVAEDGIRREGAILDRRRFDTVAKALQSEHGWR
jgi:hypothetical protein